MRRILVYVLAATILVSCGEDRIVTGKMIHISGDDIGVDFKNVVTDNAEDNALMYETFYMGGGVATGDINNDGYPDVFFSGNQVGDALYLNNGDFTFKNITEPSGIIQDGNWSTGVTMVDINSDGWLDIYVCRSLYDDDPTRRKNLLYINQKDNTFLERSTQYGIDDIWRTQEALFFDYDADGDEDLLLVNQPPNPGPLSPLKGIEFRSPELGIRFLENNGGRFSDVTNSIGIAHAGYGLSASIADVNNDGWLDVFVAHDYNSPDKLYLNRDGKRFEDVTNDAMKQMSFFTMGTDIGDINNDGQMDLVSVDMVADDPYRSKANMGGMVPEAFWEVVESGGNHQYMYNTLHLNQGFHGGTPLYGNINFLAGMSKTDWSWSPILADFDNDGYKDLYITNGIKRDLRFTDALSKVEGRIEAMKNSNDAVDQTNVGQHMDALDLLEAYPSTPLSNYIFHNTGHLKLDNVSKAWGMSQPTFSTGAAVADFDLDGDLDVVVSNLDESPFFYKNELSNNRSLRLKLIDSDGSIATQGSRVEVYLSDSDYPLVTDLRVNRGFYSTSEPILHIGLGDDVQHIDSVRVLWSPAEYSVHRDLDINRVVTLSKGRTKIFKKEPSNHGDTVRNMAPDLGISEVHRRVKSDDYAKQVLLPYEIGAMDRPFAVADFNHDGKEDILIGGTSVQPWVVYIQTDAGAFRKGQIGAKDGNESAHLVTGDMDGDGDLDVYVSVGGNGHSDGSKLYRNYFLINNGDGTFSKVEDRFITKASSSSHADLVDYDADGDLDIISYGRHTPWQYPYPGSTTLLKNNGNLQFEDVTQDIAPDFIDLGMVTASTWANIDSDDALELIVGGDWMPITVFNYENGQFVKTAIEGTSGWWRSLTTLDYNNDGINDILAGNIGDNAKYKTNAGKQFHVYYDDLDANGKSDIVLTYEKSDKEYPVRGRSCSSEQIPDIAESIPTYDQFASLSIDGVYGDRLQKANKLTADDFSSLLLTGLGDGSFSVSDLPVELQVSTINDIERLSDSTYIAVGNMRYMEVETPNIDAGYGQLFRIREDGSVKVLSNDFAPLLRSQVDNASTIHVGSSRYLVVFPYESELQLIPIE